MTVFNTFLVAFQINNVSCRLCYHFSRWMSSKRKLNTINSTSVGVDVWQSNATSALYFCFAFSEYVLTDLRCLDSILVSENHGWFGLYLNLYLSYFIRHHFILLTPCFVSCICVFQVSHLIRFSVIPEVYLRILIN